MNEQVIDEQQKLGISAPVVVALRELHPERVAPKAIGVPRIHLPKHILCVPKAWHATDGPAQSTDKA